jgi:hypothetical protein
MSKLKFSVTMSLGGYVAGPNQTLKEPLGVEESSVANGLPAGGAHIAVTIRSAKPSPYVAMATTAIAE